MTIAAPPQPPSVHESAARYPSEALIKEAKQRARRRRWAYCGAAVVVAVAALAGFTTLPGSPSPPHPATRNVPTPPAATPLGAPELQGPDPGSTLLMSWSRFHVGYAYIYADGRVIFEIDANYRGGDPYARERRLSPAGLDLVRSGRLTAGDFVYGSVPSDAWADQYDAGFVASEHAACIWQESKDHNGPFRDATSRLGDLPAAAQALLGGPRRTFPTDGFQPTSDCFVLTPQQARAALDLTGPNPWGPNEGPGFVQLIPATSDEGAIVLVVHALLPHGPMLVWGG